MKRTKKCCKCPTKSNRKATKSNRKATKSNRKATKPNRKATKSNSKAQKRVGAAPPELYSNRPMKEQIEYALSLLRESKLNDIFMDLKPHSKIEVPLEIGETRWSNLTYWNGYQVLMDNGKGNKDDIKNIIYMLKHDTHFKKLNKEEWIKNIKYAIFKGNYGDKFEVIKYRAPPIKERNTKRISLKDLTIILLEHRLEIIEWTKNNQTKSAVESKPLRDPRAAEEPEKNEYAWNNLNETQNAKESVKINQNDDVKNNWNDDLNEEPNEEVVEEHVEPNEEPVELEESDEEPIELTPKWD